MNTFTYFGFWKTTFTLLKLASNRIIEFHSVQATNSYSKTQLPKPIMLTAQQNISHEMQIYINFIFSSCSVIKTWWQTIKTHNSVTSFLDRTDLYTWTYFLESNRFTYATAILVIKLTNFEAPMQRLLHHESDI